MKKCLFVCLLILNVSSIHSQQRRALIMREGTTLTAREAEAKLKQEKCGWWCWKAAGVTALATAGLYWAVASNANNYGMCFTQASPHHPASYYTDSHTVVLDCCCRICGMATFLACLNGCCAVCDC